LHPELTSSILGLPDIAKYVPGDTPPPPKLRVGYLALGMAEWGGGIALQQALLHPEGEGWCPLIDDSISMSYHEYFCDPLDEKIEELRRHSPHKFSIRGHLDLIAALAREQKLYRQSDDGYLAVAAHAEHAPSLTVSRVAKEFRLALSMADTKIRPGHILDVHGTMLLMSDFSVRQFPESIPPQLMQAIDHWSQGQLDARRLARLVGDPLCQTYITHSGKTTSKQAGPNPILRLSQHSLWPPQSRLCAAIFFRYGRAEIDADESANRCGKHARDLMAEAEFRGQLDAWRCVLPDSFSSGYMAHTKALIPVLGDLRDAGWIIESMGKPVHTASGIRCEVRSQVDWFDLEARVYFGEAHLIQLKDGRFALLPLDLVERFATVAEFAEEVGGKLRFPRTHAALLDALLAAQNVEFDVDAVFAQASAALRHEIGGATPAAEFAGVLRPYQAEGLAWLRHMRQVSFGACLADDMGLGKTVQVLAHLQSLAAQRPHLIVVPRSVVENWAREAERFWPGCDVLIHHGGGHTLKALKAPHDLIITTYGTLRADVARFAKLQFDTCVLDEAQVVKNPSTGASKAVRLIPAEHRLALTGTPIENHLGDLWSIFDFLNPGMLGASSRFRGLIEDPRSSPNSATLEMISAAMRPYILRRTKKQVLDDLPDKTESTLYCELEGEQLRDYQLRRDRIRAELLGLIKNDGMASSKIKVIEALLRLRQSACHPGLIEDDLADVPSAKLIVLLAQLREIIDEGHKALVFSQFTSFLAFAKSALDAAGITYEYLDGSTTDRQARADRFNNDPECPVFLISLKAGGLGLNLTAASYVYVLDPWWNPAAEAQAIDRAHRIGQTKKVFAYRRIARGTVEEKVLELQARKKELADAILTADKSLLRKLDIDDLTLLLS
jgi:superfamily II DNA or RNA helicase